MEHKTIIIERLSDNGTQTEGRMFLGTDLVRTLELPWKENRRRVSCIPKGEYNVIPHNSPKFGKCFWVQDVANRSEILIHVGNYYKQILGCILVGMQSKDINNDGQMDVAYSKKAMQKLIKYTDFQPFKLVIR